MRRALLSFALALVAAAAFATVGGATNECHGIQACIRVPGPWVLVPASGVPGSGETVPGFSSRPRSRYRPRQSTGTTSPQASPTTAVPPSTAATAVPTTVATTVPSTVPATTAPKPTITTPTTKKP